MIFILIWFHGKFSFIYPAQDADISPHEDNGVEDGDGALYQKYEVGRVIGDGNFAVVKECLNRWIFSIDEIVIETKWEYKTKKRLRLRLNEGRRKLHRNVCL